MLSAPPLALPPVSSFHMLRVLFAALAVIAVLISATSPLYAFQQDSVAVRAFSDARDRGVIEPDSLDRAAFSSVAELLQARVPGLSVTRGGDGSTRIHLRGPSSVFADNAPLLVIDGVRISLTRSRLEEFEGRPNPLDDIDVEQIERIEILSGPALAGLYGTGAANGVIRISTREPHATPMRWRIFAAAGALDEPKAYPASFARFGTMPTGGVTATCTRVLEASGSCAPTGPVTSFNPLEDEGIVGVASLARAGASVASGSDLLAWSGGATFEREGSVTDDVARQRVHVRGAARARITGGGLLSLRAHWMEGSTPLTSSVFTSVRQQGLIQSPSATWAGFAPYPEPERDMSRRGLSLVADWRATSWLRGTIESGLDYSSGTDSHELTFSLAGATTISREYVRQRRHDFTGRAQAEATYGLGASINGRTTAVVELVEHRRTDRYETESRTSDGVYAGEFLLSTHDQNIAGIAMEQEISAGHRATARLALRHEDLDWFGFGWKTPWYPHASLVLIAMKDDRGMLGGLRFRVAYGKAGAMPSMDAGRLVILPPWAQPIERKAEVTAEREAGLDATLLGGRGHLSVAWYSKRTTDVLMESLGASGVDFGEVLNRGIEGSLRLRFLDAPRTRWNVRLGYAHNHNEVTSSGSPSLYSSRQWILQGSPLAAYIRYPVSSAVDADGDGVLETSCFTVQSQTCEVMYSGEPESHAAFPPTEVSLENAFGFGPISLSFLIDHRRGHYLHNLTEAYRCRFGRCADAYATALSPDAAIRRASAAGGNTLSSGAFIEKATFTKLRELSVRLEAPVTWARSLRARRLELSLAGRNLATWSDYTGMDPEASSYGDNGLLVGDLASTPLPRSLSLRVTVMQ